VRQLLRFSSNQERADAQVFGLDAAIGAMEPELQRLTGKSVELRIALAAPEAWVQLDWGAPEEVLLNLTTNALNAMPQGGVLSIETSMFAEPDSGNTDGTPRWARLRVTDTGRGMDTETLRRAFEPFFTTRPGSSGTGLGLAMVHRIVTRAGGRVSLHSEPGKGTAVIVELPVIEGSAPPKPMI
jgi:signal transduction histidine kinase